MFYAMKAKKIDKNNIYNYITKLIKNHSLIRPKS